MMTTYSPHVLDYKLNIRENKRERKYQFKNTKMHKFYVVFTWRTSRVCKLSDASVTASTTESTHTLTVSVQIILSNTDSRIDGSRG